MRFLFHLFLPTKMEKRSVLPLVCCVILLTCVKFCFVSPFMRLSGNIGSSAVKLMLTAVPGKESGGVQSCASQPSPVLLCVRDRTVAVINMNFTLQGGA